LSKGILHISKDALEKLVTQKVDQKIQNKLSEEERQKKINESRINYLEKELAEKHNPAKPSEPLYFYKTKANDNESVSEDWLITYSDVITIILTLFILIFSLSKFDLGKFEQMKASIDKEFLKKEVSTTSFEKLGIKMETIFKQFNMHQEVNVKASPRGLVINLSSNSLYDKGSAEIKPQMLPVLEKVSQAIQKSGFNNYVVEVDGHTDDIPINSTKYETNWELSTNRATNVVKYFIQKGIPPSKLRAAGYADSRPILPNIDENGIPNEANRAKNRRVEILIQRAGE